MRTFDIRFKRKVVQALPFWKGGYKILAAQYAIAYILVSTWVEAYQHHGGVGLVRQRGRYTCELKLEALAPPRAENLSCRELAAIYHVGNPHSITMWCRLYIVRMQFAHLPYAVCRQPYADCK